MSVPTANAIGAFFVGVAACLLLVALTTCAGCQTWEASVAKPVDFTRPVDDIPAQVRVGVGGKF